MDEYASKILNKHSGNRRRAVVISNLQISYMRDVGLVNVRVVTIHSKITCVYNKSLRAPAHASTCHQLGVARVKTNLNLL